MNLVKNLSGSQLILLSFSIGLILFFGIFFYSELCLDYKNALPITLLVAMGELLSIAGIIIGTIKLTANWFGRLRNRLSTPV